MTTLAGGGSGNSQDGIGTLASFDDPCNIVQGLNGDWLVAEKYQLRKITATGSCTGYGIFCFLNRRQSSHVKHTIVSTVVARDVGLNEPGGMLVDCRGNVILADDCFCTPQGSRGVSFFKNNLTKLFSILTENI